MSILLMINSSRTTGRGTLDIVMFSSAVLAEPSSIDSGIAWLEASATILGDVVSFVVDMQPSA